VFINWISRAERARYKLVFVTDSTVTWHRLNFSILKSLAPQSVEIESGGRAEVPFRPASSPDADGRETAYVLSEASS
jgi:hypothetical protein